ncbi:MAG: helix-turn-helix domain-containing protein [Desulfotomaculum sp.]|nr:helix-turn-helix domain-containing protein [Desulfotomaculum sp.]
MSKERIILSKKETHRAVVITQVIDGTMTIREAAEVLALSERHVKRLKKGVKEEGIGFLAHKNRGRKPKHAIPDSLKKQVVHLATTKYHGANYSHLADLLAEHEGINLSVSTVRRILKAAGIESSRKHKPTKRYRSRERMPQEGLLIQIDASPHAWLEDRGPELSLVAAIDDATGKVLGATFRYQEDLDGYFEVMQQLITNYGVPMSIYT